MKGKLAPPVVHPDDAYTISSGEGDDQVRAVLTVGEKCVCVRRHNPLVHVTYSVQMPSGETLHLCPTSYANYWHLMETMPVDSWDRTLASRYSLYVRDLVRRAREAANTEERV